MSLSCFNIFLLPLDVANQARSFGFSDIAESAITNLNNTNPMNGKNSTNSTVPLNSSLVAHFDIISHSHLWKRQSTPPLNATQNVTIRSPPTFGRLSTTITSVDSIPMEAITIAFSITTVVIFLAVVPFTIFYYEGGEEEDEVEDTS
jgi:hypothetical protein